MSQVGGKATVDQAGLLREHGGSERVAGPVDRPGHRPGNRTDQDSDSTKSTDVLWDVPGVATYLQVPVSAIYKMTARKAAVPIPHIRLGGKLRFRRADVERWLTLLTVSNLKTLAAIRQKVTKTTYGDNPQTTTKER